MSALRLDEGLTLQKVIFRNSLRWSIYIINSGDKNQNNSKHNRVNKKTLDCNCNTALICGLMSSFKSKLSDFTCLFPTLVTGNAKLS